MNKYKDFQDLKDTNQQSLVDLFNKRNYGRYIDNPDADDIIISDVSYVSEWQGDVPIIKMIDFNPDKRPSTIEERMEIRNKGYSAAYSFSKTSEIETAKFELSFLNPSEIEDRYLRKRVEAYRTMCQKIVDENADTLNTKTDWRKLFQTITGKYIQDTSLNDFIEVMIFRRLPNGKGQIKWFGKKSEAVYFQEYYGFSMKQFNECFVFEDGTRFYKNNRLNTNPEPSFLHLITSHKPQ